MSKVFCTHRSPQLNGAVYLLGYCVSYLLLHKQHTFVSSYFRWIGESGCGLAGTSVLAASQAALKVSARARVSSEDWVGEDLLLFFFFFEDLLLSSLAWMVVDSVPSCLSHWGSQWFAGCWLETNSSSLPHGPLQPVKGGLLARTNLQIWFVNHITKWHPSMLLHSIDSKQVTHGEWIVHDKDTRGQGSLVAILRVTYHSFQWKSAWGVEVHICRSKK